MVAPLVLTIVIVAAGAAPSLGRLAHFADDASPVGPAVGGNHGSALRSIAFER